MEKSEILDILSTNIKGFRKEKSWTQEKLAEEAEMSVQAINFFESKRRWPSSDSLSKIATALGVEVYQLFIPPDTTPIIIKDTPENQKIRRQISNECLDEIESTLKKALERLRPR